MALPTPLEFMSLLSDAEQLAIATAALQSPQINLWMMKLAASQAVDVTDPRLQAGLAAMVAAGLLTQPRAASILAAATDAPPAPALMVTASEALTQGAEKDGRFWCTFVFTLSDGTARSFPTLLDAGSDVEAMTNQRAAALNADLAVA